MIQTLAKSKLGISLTVFLAAILALFVFNQPALAQSGIKSKTAYNVTQGRNAESAVARAGDTIEYTLRWQNTDTLTTSYAMEDDLDDVLRLADVTDYGGASMSGDVLRWPAVSVSPGATLIRTFRVRIFSNISNTSDRTMSNTYGNRIDIEVASGSSGNATYSKSAHNITRGANAESVTAYPGDVIEYTLRYTNNETYGTQVTIEDDIADISRLAELLSVSDNGVRENDILKWRDISVSSHSTVSRTFRVRVKDRDTILATSDRLMTNYYGNTINIPVSPDGGGISGPNRSKSAYNDTQGAEARSVWARPGDVITYTLTYRNNSGSSENVTIEDDITDVLYLAELVNYGGGSLSGSVLRFSSVSVSSGSRIDRTFQVRVKNIDSSTADTIMSNFYGNGVDIRVLPTAIPAPSPQPTVKGVTAYTAPATGPAENFALFGALLVTGILYARRKYPYIVSKLKNRNI